MSGIKRYLAIICALCLSLAASACGQDTAMHPDIAKPGASFSADVELTRDVKLSAPGNAQYIYELGVDIEKSKAQIEECLDVDLDDYENSSLTDGGISYTVGDWTADIMPENGYWTLSYNGQREGAASDISDERAVAVAAEYLRSHGLLGDIKSSDAMGLCEGLKSDGTQGVLYKEPYFYPQVEGMDVLGMFRIAVLVNTDEKVIGVQYLMSDVVGKTQVQLADRAELERTIAAKDYSPSFSQNLSDTQITQADYRLYADGVAVDGKTYLYPVLVLKGVGKTADGSTESFDIIVDAQ